MNNSFYTYFLTAVLLFFCAKPANAQQEEPLTRILFIYDASNSMNAQWQSGTKHTVALDLISQSIDSLRGMPNLELALRVFGHRYDYRQKQVCEDSKLEVTFGPDRVEAIQKKLRSIKPKGTTPIALSLEKAGYDFPDDCDNCRNIIILVTDGIEECGGDPCAVSRSLSKKGITLKPFIIGIGLDEGFAEKFKCVGTYFDATNEKVFANVMGIVISQAMNSTTMQLNLLDAAGEPSETNVPFFFFDDFSGTTERSGVHTLNGAGNPDTMFLDPGGRYKLSVFTVPDVSKDSIVLNPGKHNIIAVKAGRGTLDLKRSGAIRSQQPHAIVRKHGKMQTLNIQTLGTEHKYLNGFYDLEILTLPRTYLSKVDIKQSHTTTIELPPPGLVTIVKGAQGFGSIFQITAEGIEWVCNLAEHGGNESFRLQPGRYKIVFRARNAIDTKYSREEDFSIKAGESKVLNISR